MRKLLGGRWQATREECGRSKVIWPATPAPLFFVSDRNKGVETSRLEKPSKIKIEDEEQTHPLQNSQRVGHPGRLSLQRVRHPPGPPAATPPIHDLALAIAFRKN
jgi:hypothetical protein